MPSAAAASNDAALATAGAGNQSALTVLQPFSESVHAVTDITGFGLLGHLAEMLTAEQGAEIAALSVPALPEALDTLAAGYRSSLAPANNNMLTGRVRFDSALPLARQALLTDPQTGGGLLLAVDASVAEAIVESAAAAGEFWCLIGRVQNAGFIGIKNLSSLPSV